MQSQGSAASDRETLQSQIQQSAQIRPLINALDIVHGRLKIVLDSSAGLYGGLQGIAGRALPEIESLGFLALGDTSAPE